MQRFNIWYYNRAGEYTKIEILARSKEAAIDSVVEMDDSIEIDKIVEKRFDTTI
jgi:hypothetical protein